MSNAPASLEYSVFSHLGDNHPMAHTASWPTDFLEWYDIQSESGKDKVPLWSPVTYHEGRGREKNKTAQNVKEVTALVLDYDWKEYADPAMNRTVTISQARKAWAAYEHVLHTTASHRPSTPKFRLIFPYTRPITVAEHEHLWTAWLVPFMRGQGVPSDPLADVGRMYFIPTRRMDLDFCPQHKSPGTCDCEPPCVRVERHPGRVLDPDAIFEMFGKPTPSTTTSYAAHSTTASASASQSIVDRILANAKAGASTGIFSGIENAHELENLTKIEEKCAFMAHARTNAAELPEPEWYAWLSLIGRCKDGRTQAHAIGSAHKGYSADETDDKLKRALETGPRTCENVRTLSRACEKCPLGKPHGEITTPLQLGRPDPKTATPEELADDMVSRAASEVAEIEADIARLKQAHAEAQVFESQMREKTKRTAKFATPEAFDQANREHLASKQAIQDLAKKLRDAEQQLKTARKKVEKVAKLDKGHPPTLKEMINNDKDEPYPWVENIRNVLETDPMYAGTFSYDTFADKVVFTKGKMSDHMDTSIICDIQRRYRLRADNGPFRDAVSMLAHRAEFNPVVSWLTSLTWDGTPRLDKLMSDGFGGTGDPVYLAEVGTKLLISAVARVFKPGCQVDTVVILVGNQGVRKSTGLRLLAHGWFSDTHMDLDNKDAYMQMMGTLIYEWSELDALRGKELSRVKGFISSQSDKFRPPYGRGTVDRPRQTVFVGTTNDESFMPDDKENRRLVPVPVTVVNTEWIKTNLDSLWAEAVVRYQRGEKWWYDAESAERLATAHAAHRQEDEWEHSIRGYLVNNNRRQVTIAELLEKAMYLLPSSFTKVHRNRVSVILRNMGCTDFRPKGSDCRVWRVPDAVFEGAPAATAQPAAASSTPSSFRSAMNAANGPAV